MIDPEKLIVGLATEINRLEIEICRDEFLGISVKTKTYIKNAFEKRLNALIEERNQAKEVAEKTSKIAGEAYQTAITGRL